MKKGKMRIDYYYRRTHERVWNYNYQLGFEACASYKSIRKTLNEWIKDWTGRGEIKILSITASFIDSELERAAEKFEGQLIAFADGLCQFKRAKR